MVWLSVDGDVHDAEGKHASQRYTLAQRDTYIPEIFRRPEKDDEVAERVLRRVEVVYDFDVEAFCGADVFEDLPVCAYWSVVVLT